MSRPIRGVEADRTQDLSFLNRDLSKVILLDTVAAHASSQPENAIILPKWTGNPSDKDLVALIPFLEYVAASGAPDLRKALASFQNTHIPTEFAKRETALRERFNKQLADDRAKRGKRGLGAFGSVIRPPGMMAGADGAEGMPNLVAGLEQGKMLHDQIREMGQMQYEKIEKEIRENGEKWLKEMAAEEKKAQEEQMKGMKAGLTGFFGQPKQ